MESRNQQQQDISTFLISNDFHSSNLITPVHKISELKEMLSLIPMSVPVQFSLWLNSALTRVKYISFPVGSQQEKLNLIANIVVYVCNT